MDYTLAIFKAITLIRQKSPEIFITLDITDIENLDIPEEDGEPHAYAYFDVSTGRYAVKISNWTIENIDVFNLAALIRHELGHILYGDVLDNPEDFDNPTLLNIAQDAYINSEIELFKKYENCIELGVPVLLEHISPRFNTRQNTSFEVYNYLNKLFKDNKLPTAVVILMQELEEKNGNSNGNKGDEGESSKKGSESGEEGSEEDGQESDKKGGKKSRKESDKESDKEDNGEEKRLTSIGSHKNHGKKSEDSSKKDSSDSKKGENSKNKLSELEKEIAQSLVNNLISENMDKFMGKGSANIDRIVENMKKAEYDFKKLFAMAVHRTLYSGKRSTWLKPNRRLKHKAKGYKPTPKPKVLILTDLSGSIDQETIEIVAWQHDYLAKEFDFDACWGDTRLEGFMRIKQGQKPKMPFVGGGGTDLNFFEDLEKKYKYDLIIFNTDGFIPPIKETPSQKIFCIYGGGREVSGFLNIKINPFKQETRPW